ncbi:hypothetical protein BD410DRAFT_783873 [Rickenella mellea]|uniref:Uncharacterized protein n=1 Tax=Rickenella mellea TaxID=50990 RepID=A0A4Y7QE33_9AGAM|nr:hypothetical protein BD410DRAFT_783873 [Rickenella mellea]
MDMSITAPILYGLGARILYNQFTNASTRGFTSDNLLQGVWQGVLLCYFWTEQTEFSPAVAVGIAARVAIDYFVVGDATKSWTLVLGTFAGVLTSSLLGKLLDEGVFLYDDDAEDSYEDEGYSRHGGGEHGRSRYSPSIRDDVAKWSESRDRRDATTRLIRVDRQPTSLETEVELLRSRAAAADAKRRRRKDEQKLASFQGDHLRSHQLAWQIERYSALADSYGKEADSKLIEDVSTSLRRNRSISVDARLREYVTNGWNHHTARHPSGSVVQNHNFDAENTEITGGGFVSAPFRPTSDEWSRALD